MGTVRFEKSVIVTGAVNGIGLRYAEAFAAEGASVTIAGIDGAAVATSGRVSIAGYGHYFETYRKCADGRWRISSKRNQRLRLDQVPWTLGD